MNRAAVFFSLILVTPVALSETTLYVSDTLSAAMRTGKTYQHKILKFLRSGTPVTVLEVSNDGYTKVRIANGMEGWVLSRELMETPSARDRIPGMEQKIQGLADEKDKLLEDISELTADKEAIAQRYADLQRQYDELMREIQTLQKKAARPLEIAAQNRSLKEELVKEREDIKKLLKENAVLRDRANRDWFLAGAGVVLASLFLGLVIPKIPWRRRRSWGEL